MTENIILFKDLSTNGVSWQNKPFVEILENHLRIYYSIKGDGKEEHGFDFVVVEFASITMDDDYSDEESPFDNKTSFKAYVLLHGIADFDCVWHLYMGHETTENEGYLYYPNMEIMPVIFEELNKLSKKYCTEV